MGDEDMGTLGIKCAMEEYDVARVGCKSKHAESAAVREVCLDEGSEAGSASNTIGVEAWV